MLGVSLGNCLYDAGSPLAHHVIRHVRRHVVAPPCYHVISNFHPVSHISIELSYHRYENHGRYCIDQNTDQKYEKIIICMGTRRGGGQELVLPLLMRAFFTMLEGPYWVCPLRAPMHDYRRYNRRKKIFTNYKFLNKQNIFKK